MQIQKLEEYCKTMLLDFNIDDEYLELDDKIYKIVVNGQRMLIDEETNFIAGEDEDADVDGYVFEFGGRWYTQPADDDKVQLDELRYIGNAKAKLPTESFLGIRSGMELMNGMGLYPDWVAKAKFLGIKNLAICERSTLSGVLLFQNECKKNDIKSIIGMTIPVKGDHQYDIKLYVKNFQGWLQLLKFNEKLNVDGEHYIEEDFLIANCQDLVVVADPKSMELSVTDLKMLSIVDYFQLDTVRFLNEDRDREYLDNLENWITRSRVDPIAITDAFYLEQVDYRTREVMWTVAKAFDDKTNNQHFKDKTEYASELVNMFDRSDKTWITLYKLALANEGRLVEACNFSYDTDTRHLPKYEMTDFEKLKYKTNEKLFLHLIKKGFRDRNITDRDKYIERLKVEIEVLKAGDVIDYFLSLYDIIRFAKSKDMLTGIGRGSAGGSLVAYLLGIIQIDPLEFDLLFERFLNSGRMGKWEDRPLYIFEDDEGNKIELAEGDLARIKRNKREMVVYCHDIKEGDEIIKV